MTCPDLNPTDMRSELYSGDILSRRKLQEISLQMNYVRLINTIHVLLILSYVCYV